ncbi:hypothetical protein [Mycobacterium sp. Marseille-P9652]|uniref:hypothetical protein n=1 Tax=Mycobacterium sp. Marseille-P9652 TaxID=2654950 RepID=UPI001E474127|nr:hypothetical protein [Mycobacterium sp. Marseille-P9652]
MAEQAEAEAEEAEALAAAARARARAIQLRRQAEQAEAEPELEEAEPETAEPTDDAEEGPADSVDERAADVAETEPVEPESPESEEGSDEAVAAAEAGAPAADAPAEPRARRRRVRLRRPRWSTVAAALAILVIVAALSGSGYMIYAHRKAEHDRQLAAEFSKAASQGIINLTSLDFNDAKRGVQLILDNATGEFKDDFTKTADQYVKTVEQIKVHSQGTVQAAAVDRNTMTDDSAVVLVASTQEVTNAAGAKQEPRSYRFVVTMKRDGDQLKIAKLEFVP